MSSVNWSTWVGLQQPAGEVRVFNDVYAVASLERLDLIAWVDVGTQAGAVWGGGNVQARGWLTRSVGVSARAESFVDPTRPEEEQRCKPYKRGREDLHHKMVASVPRPFWIGGMAAVEVGEERDDRELQDRNGHHQFPDHDFAPKSPLPTVPPAISSIRSRLFFACKRSPSSISICGFRSRSAR